MLKGPCLETLLKLLHPILHLDTSHVLEAAVENLPRLYTGFFVTVSTTHTRRSTLQWKQSSILPFFRTRLCDFACLDDILAQVNTRSWSSSIHLLSITVLAVTVMSSMNALVSVNLTPDFVVGPLLYISTDLRSWFIALPNSMTEMVHPATIPPLSCCLSGDRWGAAMPQLGLFFGAWLLEWCGYRTCMLDTSCLSFNSSFLGRCIHVLVGYEEADNSFCPNW